MRSRITHSTVSMLVCSIYSCIYYIYEAKRMRDDNDTTIKTQQTIEDLCVLVCQ